MKSGDGLRLGGLPQFLPGEGSSRIEQSVVGDTVDLRNPNERLADEAVDRIRDVRRIDPLVAGDRLSRLQREHADKDRQPIKDFTIPFRQKIVAPVQHRVQGLMARQSAPTPLPEKLESVAQQLAGPA